MLCQQRYSEKQITMQLDSHTPHHPKETDLMRLWNHLLKFGFVPWDMKYVSIMRAYNPKPTLYPSPGLLCPHVSSCISCNNHWTWEQKLINISLLHVFIMFLLWLQEIKYLVSIVIANWITYWFSLHFLVLLPNASLLIPGITVSNKLFTHNSLFQYKTISKFSSNSGNVSIFLSVITLQLFHNNLAERFWIPFYERSCHYMFLIEKLRGYIK